MHSTFKIIIAGFITVIALSFICRASEAFPVFTESINPPRLNRVWVQGEAYKSDTAISELSMIKLPFGKNFFTVEFISINYSEQHKLQYSYQLDGIDSSWVHSGNQRRVSYANLGPGTYSLRVKVSKNGIHWVQNKQCLNIVVTPPFWAVWWYHLLTLLLVFLVLIVIYKVKINVAINKVLERADIRKKESESLRLMMAQDFHDEMGNKLASIIVLVSTLQILIKDTSKDVQNSLIRIEKSSKELFDGTKTFIWSINPDSDTLGAVVSYINQFGVELFEHTQIEFTVDDGTSNMEKELSLSVGDSRQLFFILKEVMTNALVHSNAVHVTVSYAINKLKTGFSISFEDDGDGVSLEQLESSRGLKNMKGRAIKINSNIAFYHNPGGGFGVRIEGDFPKT